MAIQCQQFARAVCTNRLRSPMAAASWWTGSGLAACLRTRLTWDEWLKAVAPSDELRRWYGHQPGKFAEFKRRYEAELKDPERADALRHLREEARSGPVTLLTASKDLEHSEAAVLAQLLRSPQGTPH